MGYIHIFIGAEKLEQAVERQYLYACAGIDLPFGKLCEEILRCAFRIGISVGPGHTQQRPVVRYIAKVNAPSVYTDGTEGNLLSRTFGESLQKRTVKVEDIPIVTSMQGDHRSRETMDLTHRERSLL